MAAALSQEELAERAGLSRRGIADLERGARRFPYADTLRRLAEALSLGQTDVRAFVAAGLRPHQSSVGSPSRLPMESSHLVGRERELNALHELLRDNRLLTLTGAGGIGKTRLAVELAVQVETDYEHGAVFVDLAPVTDPHLVPHAAARALGVPDAHAQAVLNTVRDHIGSRQLLLVLDNCEHVLTDSAQLADMLVRNCPALHILATSREALRIPGETAWSVPALEPDHAYDLFVERTRSAQANIRIDDLDAARITEICRRLDGMPLAIELAAARVPALGLVQVASNLEQRLRLLSRGNRLDAPRHQTLRAAIGWSYDLLSEPERRLFERLSVFAGGWTMPSAEAVCGGPPLKSSDVFDLSTGLVDKSLVVVDERNGRVRYRLLEVIREYASERLGEPVYARETVMRHAAYFRDLAEAGASTRIGVRYPRDMDLVADEQPNFRAALAAMLSLGELQRGLGLCQALGGFWLGQGHLTEGQEWLERFLERQAELPWDTLADGLFTAGRIAEYRGAFDRALSAYQHSLGISRSRDDATRAARALAGQGDVAVHRGAYEEGVALLEEALALSSAAGSLPEVTQALWSLSRLADARGDSARSRALREECLRIQRQLGDRWGVAYSLHELGLLARREGQLDRAQALHEESHVLWRQSGSHMGERAALMNLAMIAFDHGSMERAAAIAMQVLDLCRDIADASATAVRCVEIGSGVLLATGSAEAAVTLIAAATAAREALGAPVPPQERDERHRALSAAQAAVDPSCFQRAWHTGTQLGILDAVELTADSLTRFVDPR